MDRDRNEGDTDQNDANEITQRQSGDEQHSQQNRHPNYDFAQIRLEKNEEAWRSGDGATEQQSQHWMHVAKLTQEQCKHHDASNDGQLRWLKIDRPKVQPTARAVNLRSHHLGQNEKDEAE